MLNVRPSGTCLYGVAFEIREVLWVGCLVVVGVLSAVLLALLVILKTYASPRISPSPFIHISGKHLAIGKGPCCCVKAGF